MNHDKPGHQQSSEFAPQLAVKISLCLWMIGVVFIFIIRFFPLQHLYFIDNLDIETWVIRIREWLHPFFHEFDVR